MPNLSQSDLRKMRNHYRHDVARFLAKRASAGELVTYGELSDEFGGIARGWGNTLGGIALRCRENGLPALSVIVVEAATRMPSTDAVLYEDLGIVGAEAIKSEQDRCFAIVWSDTKLG